MFSRFLTVLLMVLTVSACRPGKRTVFDPATVQTPAGEAALRYLIEKCPKRAEAKVAVIMVGDSPPAAPKKDFAQRFENIPGLTFVDFTRVVAGMVKGVSRRFDEVTREPVLELQISAIEEGAAGSQEATVAWAFMDDAERKRLKVSPNPNGGFEVQELETIPVRHRNDDTQSAPSGQ